MAMLRAGTLIEEDLFTGNSPRQIILAQMQEFFDEHGQKWPLMCMEFGMVLSSLLESSSPSKGILRNWPQAVR